MTVDLSLVEKIPGWLYPNDMDLTERVFRFQGERGVRGDILELGVYKGKYLALLYGLSAASDRVGVDGLYEKHGVLLGGRWRLRHPSNSYCGTLSRGRRQQTGSRTKKHDGDDLSGASRRHQSWISVHQR